MGLLVGNTTVIEHAGVYVEFARTIQHMKFQPVKASIGFVVPKAMKLSDAQFLARQIVAAQLGLEIHDYHRANNLCKEVFDEPITAFVCKVHELVYDND